MRLLQRVTKYAIETVTYPIDANPWLESIQSSFGTVAVGDAPDLVESYTVVNGVLTLRLEGGVAGITYRVPVTFTAANGMSRAVVVEVSVAGVAESPGGGTGAGVQDSLTGNSTALAPSVRAVNAALAALGAGGSGGIDGGAPDSTYGTTAIDGGSP